MPIKSFRGLLADTEIETIRLSTNNGLTGYKIKKFQLFVAGDFGTVAQESLVQLYTVPQTAAKATTSFDDPTLLACALLTTNTSPAYPTVQDVVFDSVAINQDIYITHVENNGSQSINYHLELEQIKLSSDEAAVATLKDMRGRE